MDKGWLHDPRRLRAVFLAVMSLLVVVLAGFGWKLLDQDRQLAATREIQQRDAGATILVATIERRLSGWQQQLGRLLADPAAVEALAAPDALFVRFNERVVDTWPTGQLIYSPAASLAAHASGDAIAVAADAARAVNEQRFDDALAAYRRLEGMDDVAIAGMPAPLAAHAGRLRLFERAGDHIARADEARALSATLAAGRWPIGIETYTYLSDMGREALPDEPPGDEAARSVADSVGWLWDQWSRGGRQFAPGWTSHETPAGPVLVVWQVVDGRLAALVGPQDFVARSLLADLQTLAQENGVEFALVAEGGERIVSTLERATSSAALRPSSTSLPWTIEVAAAEAGPSVATRRQFLVAGIGVLSVLILGGAWVVGRSVTRELEAARVKSDFVAAVSHEFRTPLTTLCQLSELLMRDRVAADDDRREYYALLHRESERLRRMVEGLLSFGRLEAGNPDLELQPIDLEVAMATWLDEFGRAVDLSRHQFTTMTTGRGTRVMADPDAMKSVFWNLFENAVKYSPDGGVIAVEIDGSPSGVRVEVSDHGVGIPDAEQRAVFEPFVRGAEARNRQIRGTGIGLAIARAMARAHGGEIDVRSTAGGGSTFTVELPSANGPRPAGGPDIQLRRSEFEAGR